eukprot:6212415-Pleurochrysis_carterae.AAC.2
MICCSRAGCSSCKPLALRRWLGTRRLVDLDDLSRRFARDEGLCQTQARSIHTPRVRERACDWELRAQSCLR